MDVGCEWVGEDIGQRDDTDSKIDYSTIFEKKDLSPCFATSFSTTINVSVHPTVITQLALHKKKLSTHWSMEYLHSYE